MQRRYLIMECNRVFPEALKMSTEGTNVVYEQEMQQRTNKQTTQNHKYIVKPTTILAQNIHSP